METKTFNEIFQEVQFERESIEKHAYPDTLNERVQELKDIGLEESANNLQKRLEYIADAQLKYTELKAAFPDFNSYLLLSHQLVKMSWKYNLFLREAKYFTGDIPDSAIKRIKAFVDKNNVGSPLMASMQKNFSNAAFQKSLFRIEHHLSEQPAKFQAENGAFIVLPWNDCYLVVDSWVEEHSMIEDLFSFNVNGIPKIDRWYPVDLPLVFDGTLTT
ncbi:hypothetical protein [Flavobacterium filum]|uniref:hypothetical protein n=1 Tax=Flavobacterium filum TaxID=370974 RepID=UPI0023EF9A01|nr:hypothetical protein [Flavobacterium filum]